MINHDCSNLNVIVEENETISEDSKITAVDSIVY